MNVHELSPADARRIAVRAQLLDVVSRLTLLQIDPVSAIAPSADLVAWSRLGSSYSPAGLTSALADRTLVELVAMIRPAEDVALYRAGHGPLGTVSSRTRARRRVSAWRRPARTPVVRPAPLKAEDRAPAEEKAAETPPGIPSSPDPPR